MESLAKEFKSLDIASDFAVGVFYHLDMLLHKDKNYHPERHERLTAIIEKFTKSNLLKRCKVYKDFGEVDSELIADIHGEKYVDYVKGLKDKLKGKKTVSGDTYYNSDSFRAANLAVNALILAVDELFEKKLQRAFGVVRPPGHHAAATGCEVQGFCIYNNVAVAAQYAMKHHNVKKILIFDWDVHHGDSTSKLFYNDPRVLFISLHRYDRGSFFPGDGSRDRLGEGPGIGYNLNCPWNLPHSYASIGDDEYVYAFERLFWPIMEDFKPEMVFVSAGFDSGRGDPLGGIDLTPDGYAYMLKKLLRLAPEKTIVSLEGGYNLETISSSAEACLRILLGEELPLSTSENMFTLEEMKENCSPSTDAVTLVNSLVKEYAKYWPILEKEKGLLEYQNKITGKAGQSRWLMTGSHPEKFLLKNELVLKEVDESEWKFYKDLTDSKSAYKKENQTLVKLAPVNKGTTCINNRDYIVLENLLHNYPKASMLDLNIGKEHATDESTNENSMTKELGFQVSGFLLKDDNGKVIEHCRGSEAQSKYNSKNMEELFIKLLLSNGTKTIESGVIISFRTFVNRLREFLENTTDRYWIGSSVLFIVDNTKNHSKASWISLGKWKVMNGPEYESSVTGLKNIENILKNIKLPSK